MYRTLIRDIKVTRSYGSLDLLLKVRPSLVVLGFRRSFDKNAVGGEKKKDFSRCCGWAVRGNNASEAQTWLRDTALSICSSRHMYSGGAAAGHATELTAQQALPPVEEGQVKLARTDDQAVFTQVFVEHVG